MPDGYAIIVAPDAPTVERDTLQCVHCGKHWFVVKGSGRMRGFCMKCNGVHCGGQHCWECRPWAKVVNEGRR
jgi:hypothetical protein